jgi:UDP-N-acetylmuramate dehydrogenase
MRLADLTTFRVGGDAGEFITVDTEADLINAVREADEKRQPLLLLAGGSNLLIADEGFDGRVVHITSGGFSLTRDACSGGMVTVPAGQEWDSFVAQMVDFHLAGIESLSGIPGSTGATPIQNVGAYGQQVSDTIAQVRTYDREEKRIRTFAAAECDFGYRSSIFKKNPDRYVVLSVTFQLRNGEFSDPIRYQEIADALGVSLGERAPLDQVRNTILDTRRKKGMILEREDHDTWSAGSFFINPVVTDEQASALPAGAPRWSQVDGSVKTSAAWLIEASGVSKGLRVGGAAISSKHVLAITNTGSAKASEIIELATQMKAAVRTHFGIELHPEPRLVGLQLP